MTTLPATAENFRAESARYRISQATLAEAISMHRSLLSDYMHGRRMLPPWAQHNIAMGINQLVGQSIFETGEPANRLIRAPIGRARLSENGPASFPLLPMDRELRQKVKTKRRKAISKTA